MIRRPPRSTLSSSSAASDVYKRQGAHRGKEVGLLKIANIQFKVADQIRFVAKAKALGECASMKLNQCVVLTPKLVLSVGVPPPLSKKADTYIPDSEWQEQQKEKMREPAADTGQARSTKSAPKNLPSKDAVIEQLCELVNENGGSLPGTKMGTLYRRLPGSRELITKLGGPKKFCARSGRLSLQSPSNVIVAVKSEANKRNDPDQRPHSKSPPATNQTPLDPAAGEGLPKPSLKTARIPSECANAIVKHVKRDANGNDCGFCKVSLPQGAVSYTHLRAHETPEHLVCRLLLEKKKNNLLQQLISEHNTV
eukprot:TRINITY_DN12033_c0_g1_i2.p1 TRINITY_DN12033_c0_g1~~TRINITY_DN12033_c0_g1_i2.p1  ORF type:complete len:310 (+),score=23.03 TRINITY_DN12033_c0_g1_i2:132-1061(+)